MSALHPPINITAEYLAFHRRMQDATPAEKLAVVVWARGLREQLSAEAQRELDLAVDRTVHEMLSDDCDEGLH